MKKLFPYRPSPAMAVALVALFVSLGGSSYAAIKIGARNVKTGAVGTRAIANNSVRSKDIRTGNVAGGDVKDESLTNADIVNGDLVARSATDAVSATRAGTAARADTASTAGNADRLGGQAPSAFTRRDCSSLSGAVKGFARVNAGPGFSSTFTTAGVQSPYNCSGQAVEARRAGTGVYEVRFNGNGAGWALVGTLRTGNAFEGGLAANATYDPAARLHRVMTFQTNNLATDDIPFVIQLF